MTIVRFVTCFAMVAALGACASQEAGDHVGTSHEALSTLPTITFTAPAEGATVHGSVATSFTVSDPAHVAEYVFLGFQNGTVVRASLGPNTVNWDSTKFPNGPIRLCVDVEDEATDSVAFA